MCPINETRINLNILYSCCLLRWNSRLSRPTSVFRTTIGVCKILSRSVEIWKYEGQKPVFGVKTERPSNNIIISRMIIIVMSSWPQVIARVHSVHLMNVEQRQTATDPQTKPPDLSCESACRLLSSTTTIAIYYYYSARKLILIYRPT